MGDKLPFSGVLYVDGTKWCEVEEIPEFIGTTDPAPDYEPAFTQNADMVFTGRIEIPRKLRRLLLGWNASGPVRYRMLRKALRMLPIKGVAL